MRTVIGREQSAAPVCVTEIRLAVAIFGFDAFALVLMEKDFVPRTVSLCDGVQISCSAFLAVGFFKSTGDFWWWTPCQARQGK